MKDFNLSDVFCEVLSGAVAILVLLCVLDLGRAISLKEIVASVVPKMTLGAVTGAAIVSYLMGLLVDSIGLAAGEWFLDRRAAKKAAPADEETADFWKAASGDLVEYRTRQWTYYSAYRNLFLLLAPGSFLLLLVTWKHVGPYLGLTFFVVSLVLEVCLFSSMRTLIRLYYELSTTHRSLAATGTPLRRE